MFKIIKYDIIKQIFMGILVFTSLKIQKEFK